MFLWSLGFVSGVLFLSFLKVMEKEMGETEEEEEKVRLQRLQSNTVQGRTVLSGEDQEGRIWIEEFADDQYNLAECDNCGNCPEHSAWYCHDTEELYCDECVDPFTLDNGQVLFLLSAPVQRGAEIVDVGGDSLPRYRDSRNEWMLLLSEVQAQKLKEHGIPDRRYREPIPF